MSLFKTIFNSKYKLVKLNKETGYDIYAGEYKKPCFYPFINNIVTSNSLKGIKYNVLNKNKGYYKIETLAYTTETNSITYDYGDVHEYSWVIPKETEYVFLSCNFMWGNLPTGLEKIYFVVIDKKSGKEIVRKRPTSEESPNINIEQYRTDFYITKEYMGMELVVKLLILNNVADNKYEKPSITLYYTTDAIKKIDDLELTVLVVEGDTNIVEDYIYGG